MTKHVGGFQSLPLETQPIVPLRMGSGFALRWAACERAVADQEVIVWTV
jgi:hypothetical protein